MPPCIYCGNAADSPEHWLPRSLGTFGPLQVLHDKICLYPEHLEGVKPALSEVFPKFKAEHFARSGAGQQRRTILFENQIGPTYLRAVAKIAFHGALRLRPELNGNEWEFDVLRRFI